MVGLRSFLLLKSKPGKEKEVRNRVKDLAEVVEIHLITGKFDLLVALESPGTELDPRRKVVELVTEKIRKAGDVIDTRTIIPIESQLRPTQGIERPTTKGFVFIASEAGKAQDMMRKLFEVPEVLGVYLLFGKADVLAELEVEKSMISPPPQHIADIVENQIAKMPAVHDTETYVPLESIIK